MNTIQFIGTSPTDISSDKKIIDEKVDEILETLKRLGFGQENYL